MSINPSALISIALLAAAPWATVSVEAEPARRWIGVTVPSESLDIGAAQDGVLAVMAVSEGAVVKKGDLLFQLTTELEEFEVARLRTVANSKVEVRKAEASRLQAEKEEKRYLDLHRQGIAGDSELDERRREAELARIRLDEARVTQDVNLYRYKEAKVRLAQRIVRSPIDGYVAKRLRARGEPVEKYEPVLKVVSLEPLWVEFDCPIEDAAFLPKGATVMVRPVSDTGRLARARVVFASESADAASQTFRVRLELERKQKWKAGLKVHVETGEQ